MPLGVEQHTNLQHKGGNMTDLNNTLKRLYIVIANIFTAGFR